MSVYRLGKKSDSSRQAIKFSVGDCKNSSVRLTVSVLGRINSHYLRKRLAKTLNGLGNQKACLDFRIHKPGRRQLRNSKYAETSLENWTDRGVSIAKIEIFQDSEIGSATRKKFCENLSFNPWHSLAAHKPLGKTNRIRNVVYQHISKVRHEKNREANR